MERIASRRRLGRIRALVVLAALSASLFAGVLPANAAPGNSGNAPGQAVAEQARNGGVGSGGITWTDDGFITPSGITWTQGITWTGDGPGNGGVSTQGITWTR